MLNKIFMFSLALLTFGHQATISADTPTMDYLNDHSVEQIAACHYQNPGFSYHYPFFLKIIEKESESGFFGYHGCSSRFRIFQDVLRSLFEEGLGFDVPQDFQFLRIPGDPLFDIKNTKSDFYKLFDRKPATKEQKNNFINHLFLKQFNESFGTSLMPEALSKAEYNTLWTVVEELFQTIDVLSKEDLYSWDDTKQQNGDPLAHLAPVKLHKKGPSTTNEDKQKALILTLIKYAESLEQEETPTLKKKYLQSNKVKAQLASVFASKLDSARSKNLNNWIVTNSTFLSLLYKIYNIDVDDHYYVFPYNDTISDQQTRIVALNIPLFGNYHRSDESSTHVFMHDSSIEGGDSKVEKHLKSFCKQLGYDEILGFELYTIGRHELNVAGSQNGCILQFFDRSQGLGKQPFSGLNSSVFTSHSFGIPIKPINPSDVVTGACPLRNNTMDLQLRLITSTHTTLNPYGFLRVVRHDPLNPKVAKNIIEKMKNKIKTAQNDSKKLEYQKAKFKKIWFKK